jgi:hypothetical protein
MKKSQADPTTARNLEDKFDRSEDVLDYFDVRKARVVDPRAKKLGSKTKFAYPVKRNSKRRPAVVREKSARYRKKN